MTVSFSDLSRRSLLQIMLLSSVALGTGAGMGASAAAAAEEPVKGGTLNFVVTPEPPSAVSIDNTFSSSQRLSSKVIEGLLKYDFDYNPRPQLATSWSVSPDGLRYTFNLRPNIKWHDGKDFTSADVAYSIKQVKELQSFGRITFAHLVDVETPDPLTAVIVLSKPSGFLLRALHGAITPIVPKHLYEGTDVRQNPYNLKPVGTGPFVFREWVKGSHVILDRNPNYWDAPKPYLDRIVIRFIPDPGARSAALETGEVHLASENPIPLSEVGRFRQLPGINVEERGHGYLGSQTQLEFNLRNPILQNPKVRLAIAHAINIEQIRDIAWYGYATLSPTPITVLDKLFHDPSIKPYPYDPALSAKLLDEAGYPLGAGNKRLDLRLTYNPGNDGFRRVADLVKQALAAVGINAILEAYDFAGYVKTVYTDGAFDLNAATHVNLFDPSVGVQRIYWSGNIKKGVAFSNASNYSNPRVDALFEAAAVELDVEKRRQQLFEFQAIVHEELPIVNFLAVNNITVSRDNIRNHTLSEYGTIDNFAETFIHN